MYRYTYTDANLVRLKAICDEYDDSYVMFNNFSMQSDALRFQRNLLKSTERTGSAHECWPDGNVCIAGASVSSRFQDAPSRSNPPRDRRVLQCAGRTLPHRERAGGHRQDDVRPSADGGARRGHGVPLPQLPRIGRVLVPPVRLVEGTPQTGRTAKWG